MSEKPWRDAFLASPTDATEYWVRPASGCVAPVIALYWYGSANWTFTAPDSTTIDLPLWYYRQYREL